MTAVYALAVPTIATAASEDIGAASLESVGDVVDLVSVDPGSVDPGSVDFGSAALPEGFVAGSVDRVIQGGIPTDVGDLIGLGTDLLNSTGSLASTQQCSASTKSGGAGIATTRGELGKRGRRPSSSTTRRTALPTKPRCCTKARSSTTPVMWATRFVQATAPALWQ